jgi:hypothetical protein
LKLKLRLLVAIIFLRILASIKKIKREEKGGKMSTLGGGGWGASWTPRKRENKKIFFRDYHD